MSFLSRIFSSLFRRVPRYEVSAYQTVYAALVSALTREGVYVGGTARYPRVEINSLREQERLDKEGALREMTVSIDCISSKSLAQAVTMNEDNLKLLTQDPLNVGDKWVYLGVIPTQLRDLVETSDSQKILYRIIQDFSLFLELRKTDEEEGSGSGSGSGSSPVGA